MEKDPQFIKVYNIVTARHGHNYIIIEIIAVQSCTHMG